jgi:Asp-tRNA(Asn)/Glu-tRNA(Gln) amidotransferase B subunit
MPCDRSRVQGSEVVDSPQTRDALKEITVLIAQVLKENPHKVDKYGKGKEQLCGFLSAR